MAEFYSARGWEIPPLPWTNLSPPFSGAESGSSRDVSVCGCSDIVAFAIYFKYKIFSVSDARPGATVVKTNRE